MKRVFKPFPVDDLVSFKLQLLQLSKQCNRFCLLESNNYDVYPHSNFGFFAAIDSLAELKGGDDFLHALRHFHEDHQDWLFGYLSYELKNQIEPKLSSNNIDGINCLPGYFFVPKYLIRFDNGELDLGVVDEDHRVEFQEIINKLTSQSIFFPTLPKHALHPRISKSKYIAQVEALKEHIQRGDIYETNFCMEFFLEDRVIDPAEVFQRLNEISKAPFGAFFRQDDLYLMCSSPERYLKKWQQEVISQPIKGTIRRGENESSDQLLREALLWDPKERSENVMIVDLVRNDLSKIAKSGSVKVEELFGIYTFEQVHQMISTVTCEVGRETHFTDIIRATFPMGSMTGAPKFRAMELIEEFETVQRGLYSGAVGYVTPLGNFDFNVVIRSILHNARNKYTSVQVGSALTIECKAEQEYNECLLKAKAMMQALRSA